jgi:hypothetical protein
MVGGSLDAKMFSGTGFFVRMRVPSPRTYASCQPHDELSLPTVFYVCREETTEYSFAELQCGALE